MGDFLLLAQGAAQPTDASARWGTLAALVVLIIASVWLGTVAQRAMSRGTFLKGFFLGNRGLGAWAIALTATVQSGGTFMGFPSLVYSHGWIVALWIGSYMVVPITGFAIIGKRIAQISRKTGAITMPDLFRERFASPALGIVTSLLIVTFMTSMMVAQFKAGGTLMKLAFPGTSSLSFAEDGGAPAKKDALLPEGAPVGEQLSHWWKTADKPYLIGLAIFSLTVIGYTLIGGFLAAVWTDLFQSVMMFFGVILLLFLSLAAVGSLQNATEKAIENAGPAIAFGPGLGRDFLPLSLALSFFIFWPAAGFASPASVTRIMACKDTGTLRKSIVILCFYNLGIYLPLICICLCARALLPDLTAIDKSDEVVPRMAILMTEKIPGGSLLSGLILAAPFGAVMATVSAYLVVIASGLVRDLYQRFVNPQATEQQLKFWTRTAMISVGLVAVALNINPVRYLQAVVVFSSGCSGASFIVPSLMLCYWRRATAAGVLAAMVSGAVTMLALYLIGFNAPDPMIGNKTAFRPFFLAGMEPMIWAIPVSALVGIAVSYLTPPPEKKLVARFFDAAPSEA
jgi:SSS family solute:Na+ symporter/sodium/pantothenate symporter